MGLTTVFSDDFSGGFKAENWGQPFDGGTYWNGAFAWSKDDVQVRDGVLDVSMTNHGGWWTAGGLNSFKAGHSITYGTIEFDGRVDEAQGTMGVFLTWPQSDNWPVDGEIDILETPAGDVMHSTHYQGPDGGHWYDSVRNQGYDETQWHHYAVEWLPDRLTIKVDGNAVAEWTDPAEIPDVAHGIGSMGFVASAADGWAGGAPDGSTPAVVRAQMDNVVMRQWDGQGDVTTGVGGAPAPQQPEPEPMPPTTPADPAPETPAEPAPGDGGASILSGEANSPDTFAFAPGEAEAAGRPWEVSDFEVGMDTLDVRPHEMGGYTYEPWAMDTDEGTVVQWSWDENERVLLRDVHGATLDELAHPAFFEPEPDAPAPEEPAPTDPVPAEPDAPAPVDPEPEQPTPEPIPTDPAPPAPEGPRTLVAGGDGRDRLSLDHASGVDVDMGDGRDTLVLGADHGDVQVFMDAGEIRGDRIEGFQDGDALVFRGFGEGASLEELSGGRVRITDAHGEAEVFRLEGHDLAASDFMFA